MRAPRTMMPVDVSATLCSGTGLSARSNALPLTVIVRPMSMAVSRVATVETDATGAFVITLPAGRYRVQADAVEGLMGTPAPADVIVGTSQALVELQYDTGIR